jgi:hypothetical protein
MTDSNFLNHDHVDSLRIFTPQYRISPRTEKRLRDAYNDMVTAERRMDIMDTTAEAQLKGAAEGHGWAVRIGRPEWEDGMFSLYLEGVRGFPDGLHLRIPQKKAWYHMDRILILFRRLAGEPAEGRGYRLKRTTSHPLSRITGLPEQEQFIRYTI